MRVEGDEEGMRVVDFLKKHYPDFSKKELKRGVDQRGCRIDGRLELFSNRTVRAGQSVTFAVERIAKVKTLELETIYEDEFLRVVNKPVGLVCDAKLGLLVHRLDKETTGLLILPKTESAREKSKKFTTLLLKGNSLKHCM